MGTLLAGYFWGFWSEQSVCWEFGGWDGFRLGAFSPEVQAHVSVCASLLSIFPLFGVSGCHPSHGLSNDCEMRYCTQQRSPQCGQV